MRKILWLLLPLLVLGLAACGAEVTPETTAPLIEVEIPYEEPAATLPYEGIELTFRSIWQESNPQAQVLTQAAQFFEKKTGATMTILWPTDEEQSADVFQIRAADFGAISTDMVLDLTEMAEKAGYNEKSHETLRTQIVAQLGFLGAVAHVPYLGGVYYNADAFTNCGITQMPQTWDEFVAISQILRQKGWAPLTLDQEDAVAAMELHLRRTIGSEEMLRYMGKDAHWHFDQTVVAAMEQVMLFVQEGNMTYGTPAEYPSGQNKMALSNAAMMVGTNADCADIEESTLSDLRWGIFPYPGEKASGTWITADMLVIHRDCENAQAAFDFVMLLTSGEFDQLRADISCGIPADPANTSPIVGAMESLNAAPPEALGVFGSRQTDAAVKLWSGWYQKASSYAAALERSK
ncbi:MAG: extracellular solute-binding protein [Clostridia bacterium]|nr:extracellular solute-binding protein [Clostridia bacterium]